MRKVFKSIFMVIFAVAMLSGVFIAKTTNTSGGANAYVIETNDSDLVNELKAPGQSLGSSYDMSKIYPLICENQTYSDFCWLYSSSKAFETALMVQRQEYYNVSEVGMSYLYYLDRINGGATNSATLSIAGNFYDFVDIYQKYGIISEADVSNDIYGLAKNGQINYSNYLDYYYITEYADDSFHYEDAFGLNTYANAYNLSSHVAGLSQTERLVAVKSFIKNYGGLFAGIEHGVFYKDNDGKYYFTSNLNQQGYDIHVIPKGSAHAVTLIGWDDTIEIDGKKGAFLAMNSWGLESTSYEYFYISYYYNADVEFEDTETKQTVTVNFDLFDALYGFIFDEQKELVDLVGTRAVDFNSTIYTSSNLQNVFTCDDAKISVQYELAVNSLDTISVKVSNGGVDLTDKFEINPNNSTKKIEVVLKDRTGFYGGYYSVKFYQNGNLLAIKTIYVFSGTESGYFLFTDEYGTIDSYSLVNTFLNMDSNVTLYLSTSSNFYRGFFNLTPMNEFSRYGYKFDFSFSVTDASFRTSNATLNSYSSSKIITDYIYCGMKESFDASNSYLIEIKTSSLFANSCLSFKLNVESILYEDVVRTYYFDIFFSSSETVTTKGSYVINYELDGGKNSDDNIVRMPDYRLDTNMIDSPLANPTKPNSNFLGWYLTPDFTGGQVTSISKALLGNAKNGAITLYAKWDSSDVEYFDIEFALTDVIDYFDVAKELDDDLIYGDSLKYLLTFNELPSLTSKEYVLKYYFYINGVAGNELGFDAVSHTSEIWVRFPDLKSGNYEFSVRVIVTIAGVDYIKTDSLYAQVGKKLVEFEFSDLEHTYDGEEHYPVVSVKDGSFYEEDLAGVDIKTLYTMSDNVPRIGAGSYIFYVDELKNENYYFESQNAICTMEISKRLVSIKWNDFNATYDGRQHIPSCEVLNKVEGDEVYFTLTSVDFINAGVREVNIIPETISNSNYYVILGEPFEFEIKKAVITIVMTGVKDRFQTAPEHRTLPRYNIFGTIYQNGVGEEDDLGITVINYADTATKSGKYVITCTISNTNYEAKVQNAIYELIGVYRVTYHLPDGTIIHEDVEEGEFPTGVSEEDLDLPLFSRIIYSESLSSISSDKHLTVEIEDYSGTVYVIGFVALFIIVCAVYYFKRRGNGVR